MKYKFSILLFFVSIFSAFGNDGTYLTRGSVIFPVKETKISLEKEILSFSVKNNAASVHIQFTFNNPENVERKLLVGFQAPSSSGDVDDETANKPVSDFTIIQNGKIIPYQLKAAECADCELKNVDEFQELWEGSVFVFLFEINFKPGLNVINHSYNFPASHSVDREQIYNYILTTGGKWAGGKIKDLTIDIDMGENQYFYVQNIFGEKAKWSIIGTGKVTNENFEYGDDTCRMVRILSGKLQIQVNNFNPTKDIGFGIAREWVYKDEFISTSDMFLYEASERNADYTKEELKILRNTIYAQHNYDFTNAELKKYFSKFVWYMPDPNLKMKDIKLTKQEQKYIEEILKREKQAQ